VVKKLDKGGISITKSVNQTRLSDEMIIQIMKEYRMGSAEINFRCDASVDDLIDVLEGNRIYIPCLYVLNKIDSISVEELDLLDQVPHYVCISAKDRWNMDELIERIWQELDLIRIYTKPKGKVPDYTEPVILPRRKSTIIDFCNKIHKTLAT